MVVLCHIAALVPRLSRVKLARNLERRLEQAVEGFAAKMFRGRIHPLELASRLVREADLAIANTENGPLAPNYFHVALNPRDVVAATQEVKRRLALLIEEEAFERGWRLQGPATVVLERSEKVTPGQLSVTVRVEPGDRQPWGQLEATTSGRRYPLRVNRAVVGRGTDSDVQLPAEEVSRRHAMVWQEGGGTWIADLGSANGTLLNRQSVFDAQALGEGDLLTFGSITCAYRSM